MFMAGTRCSFLSKDAVQIDFVPTVVNMFYSGKQGMHDRQSLLHTGASLETVPTWMHLFKFTLAGMLYVANTLQESSRTHRAISAK